MSTPSYDEIRQQIERRYRRRSFFIYHVIIAIASLSAIAVMSKGDNTFEEVMAALWFGLLVLHGVKVFMDEARDRAIERTWRRYYGDLPYVDEKPKRTLRLMDDAELEVVEEDLPERKYMRGE
jgi:hypothetical protein